MRILPRRGLVNGPSSPKNTSSSMNFPCCRHPGEMSLCRALTRVAGPIASQPDDSHGQKAPPKAASPPGAYLPDDAQVMRAIPRTNFELP